MKKAILSLLTLSSLLTAPAYAEIRTLHIEIDGLQCPYCNTVVKQALETVENLESVILNPHYGIASINVKANTALNLAAIYDAIEGVGYSIEEIKVDVVGELIPGEEYYILKSRDDHSRYLLFTYHWEEGKLRPTFSGNLKEDLKRLQEDSNFVLVQGRLHRHVGMLPGLSVDKVWPAE